MLMPAPDVDLVLKIAADDRLLPEKADLLPAEAERGRAHPLPARRMIRPRASSTSTRDAVPAGAEEPPAQRPGHLDHVAGRPVATCS